MRSLCNRRTALPPLAALLPDFRMTPLDRILAAHLPVAAPQGVLKEA